MKRNLLLTLWLLPFNALSMRQEHALREHLIEAETELSPFSTNSAERTRTSIIAPVENLRAQAHNAQVLLSKVVSNPQFLTAAEFATKIGMIMACVKLFPNSVTTGFALHNLAESLNHHLQDVPFLVKAASTYGVGYGFAYLDRHILEPMGIQTGIGAAMVIAQFLYINHSFLHLNPKSASAGLSALIRKKMQKCMRSPSAMEAGLLDQDQRELDREIAEVVESNEYKALVAQLEELRTQKAAQTGEIQDLRAQIGDLAQKFATFQSAARPASLDAASDEGSEDSLNSTIPLAESPEHLAPASLDAFGIDLQDGETGAAGVVMSRI